MCVRDTVCPPLPQEEVDAYERVMLYACDEIEGPLREVLDSTRRMVEELQSSVAEEPLPASVTTNLDITRISAMKMGARLYAIRELVRVCNCVCHCV